MASYNELNALIDAYINRNGVQAITGQILNGVLKAMVEQLGRGYTIMGAAIPTTDPGTPDGPECYFASETGTYTDFDGLQVAPGELALLCYTPSDGWTKATIYEGFQEVGATIDGNVGTPSVGVSYADGVLSFDFHNMKGATGDAAGFGTIGADIAGGIGTPGVSVESSGPATAKNLQFHFINLKGETGVTSVVATVDNTTGTPACTVSLVGQQLTLAFSGLKGAQGDTGSSVDYPFTIVNNLTTDDATQALSAAQGVVLDGKVTQLEAEVNGFPEVTFSKSDYSLLPGLITDGIFRSNSAYGTNNSFVLIPMTGNAGRTIRFTTISGHYSNSIAFLTTDALVSGSEAPYCSGTSQIGYSGDYVVPNDCAFLYVYAERQGADSFPSLKMLETEGEICSTERADSIEAEIAELDEKITEIPRPDIDITDNLISDEYISAVDGSAIPLSGYKRTDYIELFNGSYIFRLNFGLNLASAAAIAFYDADKNFVFSISGPTSSLSYVEQEVDFSNHPNVRYFRASLFGLNLYAYCKKISLIKISSAEIPDNTITTPKIIDGAITTPKIPDNAVTTSKIADGSVITPKIADGAVNEKKTIFFEHDVNSNFIDRNKLTPGYYIPANGVPTQTGASNYYITDKVFLSAGETYYKGDLFSGYCAFYQEDGTLVEGYGATDTLPNPFVVPQGAVYGRFTLNVAGADQTCWIGKTNTAPVDYRLVIKKELLPTEEITPSSYMGRDISVFSKIMCIGDSLTEGAFNYLSEGSFANNTTAALLGKPYSYPQYLHKLTGCDVTNLGKSGFTSAQWYDYYTTGAGASVDFSGYDCAIIQLGVNDVESTLETVTKQALTNIINKLKNANPGIKIFLSGIINAKSYKAASPGENYYNKDQFLRSFYNELYASDTQVFFVDQVKYGHLRTLENAQHGGSYPVDNYNEGHLSAYGYWLLAQDYVSIISYIMSHDTAQVFRKIQFIGTNYECY